ncbi:MAG: hypothetical protein H6Q90_177 [Deltaproteobacteria bacterium]|nr:hypothetical protein [Deltaproteobacteria bacterium]
MARLSQVLVLACVSSPALAQRAINDPRNSVGVPHPVPCPTVAKPKADPKLLAATGSLAGLLVDPDGFLRPEIGIAEAVALLGDPVLCDHAASSAYMNLFLLPRSPGAQRIELETKDDALIGIVVELDPPVTVDITALTKRHGKPRLMPAPPDSSEPGGNRYARTTAHFTGQLMFRHRRGDEPAAGWKVHQLIFRRSALADELPEGFHTAADVDRLIGLALRAAPPAPVDFYGTIGVVDKVTGDHISFGPALPVRNVASASIEKRTRGGRDYLHAVTIKFAKPIAIGSPAKLTGVTRTITKGKLTAIEIVRDEP